MADHARRILVVVLAALLSACGGGPEKQPEPAPGAGGPSVEGSRPGEPENLLEDKEKNQVLFDLDRLVEEWQRERALGRAMSHASIERHLQRKVAANLDMLISLTADDAHPRGRQIAARALGFSLDPRARRALVDLLRNSDGSVLESALMGLALTADSDQPMTMIAGYLDSYDPRIQQNAAMALYRGALAGAPLEGASRESAVARLSMLLLARDLPLLRGNAAAALGALGGPENENDLLNLLGEDEPYPRLKAIVALSHLGSRNSLLPLVQMLRSKEANLRTYAASALAVITRRLEMRLDPTVLGEDHAAWRDAIEARLREG